MFTFLFSFFRYETWEDPEIPRFHYGSHYSSAGSVLFYLIRLPPFSQENKQLQGGAFDHADRLFNSVKDTWTSASQGNTADVKELIPEFFYLPEFLENRFAFDFGIKQSGERVSFIDFAAELFSFTTKHWTVTGFSWVLGFQQLFYICICFGEGEWCAAATLG